MDAYVFLTEILNEEFGVPLGMIEPTATPAELGLDSLSMMEIVTELEERFEIKFSVDQLGFKTLGEAATLAEELIRAQTP